jgi:hypothetical protein
MEMPMPQEAHLLELLRSGLPGPFIFVHFQNPNGFHLWARPIWKKQSLLNDQGAEISGFHSRHAPLGAFRISHISDFS